MKRQIIVLIILISICLSSCNKVNKTDVERINSTPSYTFSSDFDSLKNNIPKLEQDIYKAINDELWYGNSLLNLDFLLNKKVQYDIYYSKLNDTTGEVLTEIDILFLTPSYLAKNQADSMYIVKSMNINRNGAESIFNGGECNTLDYLKNIYKNYEYLGRGQVSINKVLKPEYPAINNFRTQEVNNIENWLKDDIKKWLPSGSYEVCIKNFAENDNQTEVILKDKKGQYYFADLYNIKNGEIAVTRYEPSGEEEDETEQLNQEALERLKQYAEKVKELSIRSFNIDY